MPETIPESLNELMQLWKYQTPSNNDFTSNNEVFPAASYQYVLYGMGFKTDISLTKHKWVEKKKAQEQFIKNRETIRKTSSLLPTHRELINKIYEFGLQNI